MRKLLKSFTFLFIIAASTYIFVVLYLTISYPQTHWDWSKIVTNDIRFPKDFLWGTATAAHQIEGNDADTNWGKWEDDPRHIRDGSNAAIAVDGWNRAISDIHLMKELGVNSYRFSVSWNKIEPQPGKIDEDALKHYSDLIDALKRSGIEPMITLHHFAEPLWFEELGGFEKEVNIKYFIDFSKLVFTRYHDRVKYWVTLNEPNVFVTSAYFNISFPPGNADSKLGAEVLRNMLKAHVSVYQELKIIENSTSQGFKIPSQIGLAASIFQFEPMRRWHLGDWVIARIASNTFNESILEFFRTGTMNFYVPLDVKLTYTDSNAPNSLDFLGVNYYSHYAYTFDTDFKKAAVSLPVADEKMTDMNYTIYPEGIYRAIQDVSNLHKPIIITENGISDSRDDRRANYIKQSLYAVSKAISDGFDVRGYYYWSLLDNFEWAEGYTQKFGLFEVNLQTQERKLRVGSSAFTDIIEKSRSQ